MGLGIYVSVEQRRLPDFAGTQLLACGIVMIIIGLITFMITLIGAIAGFTHNKRLLVVVSSTTLVMQLIMNEVFEIFLSPSQ